MATTEVEDIAALVGIEIVPDNASEALTDKAEHELSFEIHKEVVARSQVLEKEDAADPDLSTDAAAVDVNEQLSALEKEFADRYSERDAEFIQTLATPTHQPPCITQWGFFERGRRDRGYGRGRGRGDWLDRGQADRRDFRDRGDYRHDHRQGQGHSMHDRNWRQRDYNCDRDREQRSYRERSPHRRDRY